jgi:prepilin-type processing-associated H-X9-DG protein/prepilin-type N-terminal cleavage/methylation domain-containing protein
MVRNPRSAQTAPDFRPNAFSLLELLIVLAVITIIAGTLGAASGKAQSRSRSTACLSHLRQWGAATFIHLSDNADRLPYDGAPNGISTRDAWYVDLPRSMGLKAYHEEGGWRTNPTAALPKTVWLCPANTRRSNGRMLFHYALNRRVNGSGEEARTTTASAIPEPATLVWLFENGKLAAVAAEGNGHTNAHGNGAYFLFLDGHVERKGSTNYWDFRRKKPLSEGVGLRWNP